VKRRVHVLGTGGTIAGAQADPGHYGYTPGALVQLRSTRTSLRWAWCSSITC